VSTAVNALAWGARSTFALFYVAMLEEFAWGRGPTALGYSLSWLGFVVFAPVAGWLSDRWGTRTIVTAGGVLLGVALALTGQVTSLAQYYLCFGVLGAAGIAGMLIPSTTIVTRWFVRSRGTAMGVLSAGGPGSAVVFYPLNAWLIATLGWRMALLAFGVIVAVAAVALTLLYREPPTIGERAEGGDTATGSSRGARVTGEAWTLRRALGSVRLGSVHHDGSGQWVSDAATHQVAHAWTAASAIHGGVALRLWRDAMAGKSSSAAGSRIKSAVESLPCSARPSRRRDRLLPDRGAWDIVLLVLYTLSGFGFGMRSRSSYDPADVFAGPHPRAFSAWSSGGGGRDRPFLGEGSSTSPSYRLGSWRRVGSRARPSRGVRGAPRGQRVARDRDGRAHAPHPAQTSRFSLRTAALAARAAGVPSNTMRP
jgi:MFS family permease